MIRVYRSSDASFVALQLDLYPGCMVVESGTGSGNMTVNFARAISPSGHVHTFEYNADRAAKAVAEFDKIGLAPLVTVRHGDVCGNVPVDSPVASAADTDSGIVFGFHGVGDSSVDAVFLDVPAPWLAVGHAKRVLKAGRKLCTYSPCVEQVSMVNVVLMRLFPVGYISHILSSTLQVMKTCERLREAGFHSIKMIEVRQRQFDGR